MKRATRLMPHQFSSRVHVRLDGDAPRQRVKKSRRHISAQVAGRAAVALGALLLVRTAYGIFRELAVFRASYGRLRTAWTTIPGIAGASRLLIHGRVSQRDSTLKPVVLVHGYGVGSLYLVPFAALLAQHLSVFAPDLPGHGPSDHDLRPLSIPELGDALTGWIDSCGLRSVLLVGHSLGCQVAAEAAARRPDLIAGLVMVGPTGDPAARTWRRVCARACATAWFERPTFAIWALFDYARAGVQVLAHEMRHMVRHRLEETIAELRIPVARVVRGERDAIAPQRWAESVAQLLGAPVPRVIPRWGHATHYDHPSAVADVVIEAARRCVQG